MHGSDPAEEWRALTEHYSRLNEDSLRAAAREAYDLTEIAQSVLRSEIQARRRDIRLKTAYEPPQGDPDSADLDSSASGNSAGEYWNEMARV